MALSPTITACATCAATIEGEAGVCASCQPTPRRNARRRIMLPELPPSREMRDALRPVFRLYCLSCSRATEVEVVPSRAGRCASCGGTLIAEAMV